MVGAGIMLLENWMMNDCRCHMKANSKQQTANSQLGAVVGRQWSVVSDQWSVVSGQWQRVVNQQWFYPTVLTFGCLLFAVCCLRFFASVSISTLSAFLRLKTIRAIYL